MKIIINLLFLLPLLFSCQDYNKSPFDEKEKILRQYPLVETKTMVLDSLWDKRDSLTYLRLKNNVKTIAMNEVTYIPNWIGDFKELKIFIIINEKEKKIKSIPASVGNLSNLVEFNISDNEITYIPKTFYNLKKINYLNLRNNPIKSISKKIINFKNLKTLLLGNTAITGIPQEICKLNNLESINLENTKVKVLPKCLGNLQSLDRINVSGTQLIEFPVEILSAPKLQSVQANGIKIENIKEVQAICEKRNIRFHYDE